MVKAKKSIKTTDMRGRGILLEMKSGLDMAVLPFRNLAEVMPFGKIIFSTNWKARFVARAEEFERERGARVAQAEKALSDESFRTIR